MKSSLRSKIIIGAVISVAAATVAVISNHATAAEGDQGVGHGTTKRVNASAIAAAAPAIQSAATSDQLGRTGATAVLPSRPTTGSRPTPAAVKNDIGANLGLSGAATARSGTASPNVAPTIVNSFDGVNQATACGTCFPPDVNAAVGTTQIAEMANLRLRVLNKTGSSITCDLPLNSFLGTDDLLAHPRILFDNFANRFTFVLSVIPAAGDAIPALWVAATTDADACGIWNVTRLTFSGGNFPAGTQINLPILGQDRNAMLLSTENLTPSGTNFTSFGIPKAAVFSGGTVDFPTFGTAVRTAPGSNAGTPMISTTSSAFIGAVAGTGYRVYRMTNPGLSNVSFALLGTAGNPFSAPSRRVNQPNTNVTLDPGDGRIGTAAAYDGTFLWFAHTVDSSGFPTIRYGALRVADGANATAVAFRSSKSDDFNPSINIALTSGGDRVFLNWSYTDTSITRGASPTVDTVNPGSGVPNLAGTGVSLLNGSVSTTQTRFGSYSSVTMDPSAASTSCAVAAQEYFQSDGQWRTRITRMGTC